MVFNPTPKIQCIPIGTGQSCFVIDDFLLKPQLLVDGAVRFRDAFAMAKHNAFPGLEMLMPDAFSSQLNDFFIQHIRHLLGARRTLSLYSRLSMVTLQPHELSPYQRLCHRDHFSPDSSKCYGAAVLYLFDDPSLGGTSFYAPKIPEAEVQRLYSMESEWRNMSNQDFTQLLDAEPDYLTTSNAYFELICTIPAAWNRVIFYDGGIFHSAHITTPERLAADPTQGRLTLNAFFTCRRAAAS
jgi:hypothetical protein